MMKFNSFIKAINDQKIKTKFIYGISFSLLMMFSYTLASEWISFSHSDYARIIIAIFFSLLIGIFIKDTVSYYDKIAGYDFSDFNIKKRSSLDSERKKFLGGGVNNSDVIRDSIILVIVIIASSLNLKITFKYEREFIYFLRSVPFPIIFYYLIHYFFKKSNAMMFFLKLEGEKTIEKKRSDLIKKLKAKHESDKPDFLPETKTISAETLRDLIDSKKDYK